MHAVIKTGGKQYRVKEGDVLAVEKIPGPAGHPLDFDRVLLIEDGDKILIGTPFLPGAVVRATAVETFKDEKIIVFKKKRKKQYRRTKGHRQQMTRVRIDEIVADKALSPERKPVKPVEPRVVKPAPRPEPKKVEKAAPVEAKKAPKKPAPVVKKPEKHEKPAKHAAKPAKAEKHKPEKKSATHPAAKFRKTGK